MPEHYRRNVTAVTKWCNHCGKLTLHRVDDRRVSNCLERHVDGLSKAQEKRAKQKADDELQPGLWDEDEAAR